MRTGNFSYGVTALQIATCENIDLNAAIHVLMVDIEWQRIARDIPPILFVQFDG